MPKEHVDRIIALFRIIPLEHKTVEPSDRICKGHDFSVQILVISRFDPLSFDFIDVLVACLRVGRVQRIARFRPVKHGHIGLIFYDKRWFMIQSDQPAVLAVDHVVRKVCA